MQGFETEDICSMSKMDMIWIVAKRVKEWKLTDELDLWPDYRVNESEFTSAQAKKYWVKIIHLDIAREYLWYNMNKQSDYTISEMLVFLCWAYAVRDQVEYEKEKLDKNSPNYEPDKQWSPETWADGSEMED